MIRYVTGDATAPEGDGPKWIVHCCNDKGAWGAGFVLALDKISPVPKQAYQNMPLVLGEVSFGCVSTRPALWVANLVGQHGTKSDDNPHPVKYDAIYDGMIKIAKAADRGHPVRTGNEISLHMPRMGAGLAGGSWPVIEAIIKETCGDVPVTVYDLPVKPEPRWGALTECGCWNWAMPGSNDGQLLRGEMGCPRHGDVHIVQCNVVEPPEGPGFTKVNKFWSCCS